MDLRIFIEPQQGASYEDQLAVAKATEELGFDALFRSDHYINFDAGDGLPGPTDAWTTLAGLARETSRIKLGTMVSSVTFRHPGVLAVQVAQVDAMSGGRAELGLGAGWNTREHEAYGIPFPAKRFGIYEEQLAIISGLWATPVGETFSYSGEHYTLTDSPALPKPVQRPMPLIVGGAGKKKTPRLAAKYATEYNTGFVPFDQVKTTLDRARAACDEIGRPQGDLILSVPRTIAVGATEAEATRRAEAISRDLAGLRQDGVGGTAAEAVDRIGALKELGVQRLYLQVMDHHDLDHLEFIAREIVPQLG
ncbi:LLM class F420-dependent oxidoreductase [Microlunatus endophyticus]|uniref:LLM class F420-dependent oxidoreductase n=1 Tax=Microlunatus endophyticus TaxID=1716077 RepID=A0A917W2G0_9ACTN|nr:LLM class F420-dependent oxidoreductase [Microlunatus endophyticus]GGL60409.1 LLM class F420-dependent oxidoreductase [Microlunatus endophyticus]